MNEPGTLMMPDAPARPRRWGKRLLLAGLLLLPVALVGAYAYLERVADNRLTSAMADADRLDPGWWLEELQASRAAVPDQENSALVLIAAWRLYPPRWPFWESSPPGPGGENLSPAELRSLRNSFFHPAAPPVLLTERQARALRQELHRAADALAKARRVAEMPRGRYPVSFARDYISTMLTYLQDARGLNNLLGYDVLLRCYDRDLEGAITSCRAMINVARSIGDEPTPISMMVRMVLHFMALGRVEHALAQGEPPATSLAALQRLLEEEEAEPLLLIGARGERAGMERMFAAIQAGDLKVRQLPVLMGGAPPSKVFWLFSLQFDLLPSTVKANRAALLEFNNRFVEFAKLSPEQQAASLNDLQVDLRGLPALARVVEAGNQAAIWSVASIVAASHRSQAALRCGVVLVAVERYRQKYGRWPDKLADLVPEFLQKIPIDLYDGQPLRLRRSPEGVTIYSIGPDGTDNGGNVTKNFILPGTDLGYRLWDVPFRRQQPQPDAGNAHPPEKSTKAVR